MTPRRLADQIEGLIVASIDRFETRMIAVQNRLYNDLVLVLKGVEVDAEGYILQSAVNRKILQEATFKIDEAFTEGTPYFRSIQDQLRAIPTINELNNVYFETISSGFSPNKNFIKSLQKNTISNLESNLLSDGLQAQVKNPLTDILNRNINSGGSYTGFLKEIQDFVKGDTRVEGRVLKYTKTYLHDSLFAYARSYQQAITSDLGLEWYLYAGGLMDKSRDFCIERNGGYFHDSEIKKWASLSWAGKMPGTTESSIFIYCGGHQCRHQLIPVHISGVPQEDRDRINS